MTMRAALILAAFAMVPAIVMGQGTPVPLPDPRLVDSPWGDFPVTRLERGARLRLTTVDGRQTRARLVTLGDSTLELSASDVQSETLTFAELRALRALEVRAVPLGRTRTNTITTLTGVAIGAVLGATGYRGRSAKFAEESWSGYVVARAAVGGLIGLGFGHYVLGRARWRPVSIP